MLSPFRQQVLRQLVQEVARQQELTISGSGFANLHLESRPAVLLIQQPVFLAKTRMLYQQGMYWVRKVVLVQIWQTRMSEA